VNYKLSDIVKGKVHLEEMRLYLREFVIVRNANGELNLNALKPVSKEKKAGAAPDRHAEAPETAKAKEKGPEMQIDLLSLRIGKVIYKDYSGGGEPIVQEFELNLNEEHRNITNPNALVGVLTARALMNTTIARLAKIDPSELLSEIDFGSMNVDNLGLEQFEGIAARAKSELVPKLKDMFGNAAQQVEQANLDEKASQALQSLKGLFDTTKTE